MTATLATSLLVLLLPPALAAVLFRRLMGRHGFLVSFLVFAVSTLPLVALMMFLSGVPRPPWSSLRTPVLAIVVGLSLLPILVARLLQGKLAVSYGPLGYLGILLVSTVLGATLLLMLQYIDGFSSKGAWIVWRRQWFGV
ncbi:MAG: hypothetical protein ABL898_05745 [Hyphomicrobiaceae bacterium]